MPGARLEDIKAVHSHVHALNQCRRLLRELGLTPKVHADTAGAAAEVAAAGRLDQAAIASRLAAEIYGLEILRSDIEDAEHNTTRFIILAREPLEPPPYEGPVITSFLFQVRNVPAALYKALGGFATNGVNMIKLESYVDAGFNQAQFYAEVLGHPEQDGAQERLRGAGVLLPRGRAARRLPRRPVPLPDGVAGTGIPPAATGAGRP